MSEAPARKTVEATARRHDSDVALTAETRPAPRPRSGPRAPRAPRSAPRPAGPLDRLRGRADQLLRHPAGIVGGLLVLGAVAAVAANALSFQTGRHPAPLFAKTTPAKTTPAKDIAAKGPPAKAVPGPVETSEGANPATTARADAARASGDTPSRSPKPDAIGALIRGDDHTTASVNPRPVPARSAPVPVREAAGKAAPASHPPAPVREARAGEPKAAALHAAAPVAGAKPDKSVAYAQRALIKLGYGPLTVDGIAGPSTRAALARFERERRLPGASVARRTLQELEARSGLKPD